MSFLIQRPAGRGLSLTQIDAPMLRIGRGTNQELRSENPAVALEHAIIERDAAGYLITDKGSITGTYVNRKPVETSRLTKGDVIEIGDLRIEVQLAEAAKPLFLRVATARAAIAALDDEEEAEAAAPAATPGKRVVKAKKIDYAGAYRLRRPYLTKLSITALVLIVALAIVGEVILPERQKTFMPGGVSAAHSRARDSRGNVIAHQCDACHTPWNSVTNAKCMDCHPHEPHAMSEAKTPDCFSCHAEHRGAMKLSALDDCACTSCHADLRAHMKPGVIPTREAGGESPADARSSPPRRGSLTSLGMTRIPAFGGTHPDFVWPADRNPLRFNHKLHLRGVFNEKGQRETLECSSCHALGENQEPVAIDYESHCQRCHRLTFNPRFPTAEVPHGGDPKNVYGYVAITYSGNRDLIGKPPDVVRRMLAARKGVAVDTRAQIDADQVLKAKCRQCHDVIRRGEQLAVMSPVIGTQWSDARFAHANPQHRACESCHAAARASIATSDVLLPRNASCTACHAGDPRKGQVASKCVTCHEYHHRRQRPPVTAALAPIAGVGGLGSGGRMLQGILLALIVILLLVVLVPVGIALFQRLRPERASAPQRSSPPAPPVLGEVPTAKVIPPPEATAKVAAVQAPVDVTRVVDLTPERPKEENRGTEMVQWYGMLHCTGGPLAGQRFVIEEDGFYIGRDAALAKVVIPDTRVSKRHVLIVPRDGRVWAIDEGSTNGTFLAGNAQRITEVQLKRGDTLILGDNAAQFVYQI